MQPDELKDYVQQLQLVNILVDQPDMKDPGKINLT